MGAQAQVARPTKLKLAVGSSQPIRVWLVSVDGQAADLSGATSARLILSDGSSAFYTKTGTVGDGYALFAPTSLEAGDWPAGTYRGVVWVDYGTHENPCTGFDVEIEDVPQ